MCDLDSLHCRLQNSIRKKAVLCHIINVSKEIMHPLISYGQSKDLGQIINTHQKQKQHILDKLNRRCPPKDHTSQDGNERIDELDT